MTLLMVNMSNYSTKEHLGTWHKAHRSDNESVMKVWVSSNLGHLHAEKLLIMGKTHLFIWECKTLLEIADQYLIVMCATFIEQSLHTSVHNQQYFECCIWICLTIWRRTWRWSPFSHVKACMETQLCWHKLTSRTMCFANGTTSNSLVLWKIYFQTNM